MEINQNKLKRQQEGISKWQNSKGRGTLWYEMGVGKTFTAILAITKTINYNPNSLVYVIVPSVILKQQWEKEINKHFNIAQKSNIIIFTSTEVIKILNLSPCNLLVIDEIHEFGTGNNLKILEKQFFDYKFILGLTGTFIKEDNSHLNVQKYCPVIDRVDEKEAIQKKFVSPVVQYNLAVNLTEHERTKYDFFSTEIKKYQAVFGDFIVASKCLKSKEIRLEVAKKNGYDDKLKTSDINRKRENEKFNPSKIYEYAINFVNIVQQRRLLVYKCKHKVDNVIKLCKKFKQKTIIFSENNDFADRLYHDLNYYLKVKLDLLDTNVEEDDVCLVYHSTIPTKIEEINGKIVKTGKIKLKKQIMEQYTNNTKRILVTTRSLITGLNVEDIRFLINVGFTSKKVALSQKKGRINRIEKGAENISMLMINLYCKNTIEESWLKNAQKNSKTYVKYVDTIEKITHKF